MSKHIEYCIQKRQGWGHNLPNSLELTEGVNQQITIQFIERTSYSGECMSPQTFESPIEIQDA